jgi:hypothetical protein
VILLGKATAGTENTVQSVSLGTVILPFRLPPIVWIGMDYSASGK